MTRTVLPISTNLFCLVTGHSHNMMRPSTVTV
jgi:hypothetical protein